MLKVESLSVGYGSQQVLHDISLTVDEGECLAVLGHNGAGKTSLLRCIAGLVPAKTGRLAYRGSDISRDSGARRVRRGIVLVPQGRALFGQMSIQDNVQLGAFQRSATEAKTAWERTCRGWPWMGERRKTQVALLSGGQQQLVANARGLAGEPDLLMVDEPSVGLSGVAVADLASSLADLKASGRTMILVEQNLGLAMRVCDRFLVLREGQVVGDYPKAELPSEGLWTLF